MDYQYICLPGYGVSSQGFASMRGLFHADPQLRFHCEQKGYNFGNTGYFCPEKNFTSIEEVKTWIKGRAQGWAISSSVKVNVTSGRTSFWRWEWGFDIPQSEKIDLSLKAQDLETEWVQYFENFKAEYKLAANAYLASEIDRYYPDVQYA